MSALSEMALGLFVRVHDTVYQRTGGLIGHRIPGAPNSLLLHTVGAKTGLARTNTLSYYRDGSDYLVVASNGGDRRAPGWYHNLKARPDVAHRQRQQRRALRRRPGEDDAADPGGQADPLTASRLASANTASSIAGVSRPVNMFC